MRVKHTHGNRKGKAGGPGGRPRSSVDENGKLRPNVYMYGQVSYNKKSKGSRTGDSPQSLWVPVDSMTRSHRSRPAFPVRSQALRFGGFVSPHVLPLLK